MQVLFNAPTEGLPSDDLRKVLHGGQRMAVIRSGEEILPKGSTRLSTVHQRYIQTTDRRICDSKDVQAKSGFSSTEVPLACWVL